MSSEAEQLARLQGTRRGPYRAFNPVSVTQIWQWCAAMGDRNPSYQSGDGQVAPPAMMQMWTMRDINDAWAPGSTDERPYEIFDDMTAMGYDCNVAVSYDIRFHHYLRPGDDVWHYSTVVDISERKQTSLGEGYFVTERVEYLTGADQLFAEALITYFQYRARAVDAAHEAPSPRVIPPEATADTWQPDFRDIAPSELAVGQALPELAIPVTHRLIVGGAIASQDFIPVHHNLPAAKAAGMPDIFMNILTTSGLLARYLTDWAGASARLRRLQFKLMAPNHPGDTMVMQGEVTALEGDEVSVSCVGHNSLGYHVQGRATLTLAG